jgi:hypothetical protein
VLSAARRRCLEQLEGELRARVKEALAEPRALHALKVRLAAHSRGPLLLADLRGALEAVGLRLRRAELETLMWSIRSAADKAPAKGLPLRLMRAEVMHYVAQLRLDKAIRFEDWAQFRDRQLASRRRAVEAQFARALEGKRHGLGQQDLCHCVRAQATQLVPPHVLEAEIDGRAQDAAGVGSTVGSVDDERKRLNREEEEQGTVSADVLKRYLAECSKKNFGGTIPFAAWLERRAKSWATKRENFQGGASAAQAVPSKRWLNPLCASLIAEWLQTKLACVALERAEKARRAAALAEGSGLTVQQGRRILQSFSSLRNGPRSPSAVDACFDHVLRELAKGRRTGFSSPTRSSAGTPPPTPIGHPAFHAARLWC